MLVKEMRDLKTQIETSRAIQSGASITNTTANQSQQEIHSTIRINAVHDDTRTTDGERPSTSATVNPNVNSTAFIAGDSITQILSTKRMADTNLKVNIKIHSGGRIRTVEGSLIRMAEDNSGPIKQAKAVVLHVGTNNVSDADQPESIADEMKDLANTVNNINSEAKIIVSSVLPRRNDRLVNRVISETNQALRNACEEKGYHFLDNTPSFMTDNIPNSALYRDNIHLNPRGGKTLGENLQKKIRSVLHLPTNDRETQQNYDRQHRSFQNGSRQGGENTQTTGK